MKATGETLQSTTIEDLAKQVEDAQAKQESADGSPSEEALQALEAALIQIEQTSSTIRQDVVARLKAVKEERAICDVLGCSPSQIARSQEEINADTVAYIGPLEPGVFEKFFQFKIKHVYNTSYAPENQRRIGSLETGGIRAEEIETTALAQVNASNFAQSMLQNEEEFVKPVNGRYDDCEGAKETCGFACLTLPDLGFTGSPTSRQLFEEKQLYQRAAALGLEPCLPEDVATLANAKGHDTLGEYYTMAMQTITDSDGDPSVFSCLRNEGGLWLGGGCAYPNYQWRLGYNRFVFRRRKSDA